MRDWAKKAGGMVAVVTLIGVVWSAARWCQSTSDGLAAQSAKQDIIISQQVAMQKEMSQIVGVINYHGREIYTMQANQALINRAVKAPQIPNPQPSQQFSPQSGQGYADQEPLLSKAVKPQDAGNNMPVHY